MYIVFESLVHVDLVTIFLEVATGFFNFLFAWGCVPGFLPASDRKIKIKINKPRVRLHKPTERVTQTRCSANINGWLLITTTMMMIMTHVCRTEAVE